MMKTTNRIFGCILWIIYSNILIYSSFYFNWKHQLIQRDYLIWALFIAASFLSIMWLKKNKTSFFQRSSFKPSIVFILTVLTGLSVSFMYFGKSFLYEESGYWMTVDNIGYFLLISVFVIIYVVFSMIIFTIIKKDLVNAESKGDYKYHYITLFVIQAAILCVCFYALNPGNMSYDTYNQVSQLKGIIPFNTWHPIGHTLFIGLLLEIWNNYAVITIFQIVFYSGVTSAFYKFLLDKNIRWQIIYLSAIIITALPSVGINVVTQWKDIPFTVGLVWGTLILSKICFDDNYFGKTINAVEFAVCMLIISLFRFNGILVFIVMLLYTFVFVLKSTTSIQKRNYFITTAFIFAVFITVNTLVPKQLNAVPNPPGMKLRAIYQGYSAIYVYGGEDDLNKRSRKLIETVCTPDQMREYYNPYLADTTSTNTPKFLNNLSKIRTKDAIKMYIEAFAAHPGVILGDKFNLTVTMWSVAYDRYSYNNAYTTAIQQEMIDEFGVQRKENKFTDIITEYARYTMYENYLLNTLVWRTGFYLSLEIILFLYLLLKKDRRISLFIPVVCNAVIVFLTMPAQDYRYLWFIFLLFPFLALACSIDLNEIQD
ncbi:MAG: hypothetical protein PHE34_08450 [Tissierellia bacterium]|nr:hypothetical protein [Tissierellia bacterium]